MRIWSVVSQKGGSGKTTLLLHVSIAAMAKGLAVSIFDLDPQRSAEQWAELRETLLKTEEPTVVHGAPIGLDGMIDAARDTDTDLVLIDTPPAVDKSMIYAAAAADVVIVPTRSSVLDQFALKETLDYLKRIGALAKTVVVLNAPSSDKKAKRRDRAVCRGLRRRHAGHHARRSGRSCFLAAERARASPRARPSARQPRPCRRSITSFATSTPASRA